MDQALSTQATTSVFVTAAASGVGFETARQLMAAGHRVTGAVSTSAEAAKLRAAGILPAYPSLSRAGELRSAIAANEAKIVVDLAPQVANQPPQFAFKYDMALADHVTTVNAAAKDAGVEFVIHTSYAFVAGESHEEEVEELVADLFAAVRKAEEAALHGDVAACVLRFGFLYGAENAELSALRTALLAGRSFPAGDTHGHLPWLNDADAARAVVAAVNARPAGKVITVADDTPASAADFLTHFAESQGLVVAAKMNPIAKALANKTQLALMRLHYDTASTDAKAALGWSPRFTSFRQGVDDLLLSWRAVERVGQ